LIRIYLHSLTVKTTLQILTCGLGNKLNKIFTHNCKYAIGTMRSG